MLHKQIISQIHSIDQHFELGIGVRFHWYEEALQKMLRYTGRLETRDYTKARRECNRRLSTLLCKTFKMRAEKNLTFKQLNELKYREKLYKGELDPILGYDYFHSRHPWTNDDDYF